MKLNIEQIYNIYETCQGISTDTRKIKPDSMFFALKGENFNGNIFAAQALEKGAKYAIIDEDIYQNNANNTKYILVDNVLEALQKLANFRRKKFNIPFIAIVGSNGKTTTKELIKCVLSKKYRTYATEGNLNNHIGVPITLLNMPSNTEIAVIEMGANRLGDNAELCQFVEPTHGIATNAGFDHLEGFGTIENVFRSQTELYEFLIKNNGIVIANSTDEMLGNAAKRRFKQENTRWYGSENDFVYIKLLAVNPFVLYENEAKNKVQTQLIGAYNLPNIMVALAFGKLFGVPTPLAHEAVVNYIPSNNRSQLIEKNGFHIISDAYNANPSSMQAALENLAKIDVPHKIAIIGDMFEMGKESLLRHREILDFAKSLEINQLIVCGADFYQVKAINDKALFFETKADLYKWLAENPLKKGYVLLKASRGIALETILEVL